MEFRILGPLEVWDDARPVILHGRKQRALLAILLLRAGEWVSSDVLVDAIWGEHPPRTARAALQNYVAQLRRALGAEVLASRGGGYEIAVADEQIDLGRFERLVGAARAADGDRRVEKLREALELWRGPPLADLAYEPFASHEVVRLEELRVSALEDLVDAELAVGGGPELVERLETLAAENPYRERFPAQLMLALYRAGRQADALEVYRETRRTLLEELGIEPGTALRELEQAILRQDESLDAPRPSEKAVPLEERRKLVTVLFADVACSATVDPELLHETTLGALKGIRAALERHGAQIELRASDEVMAVFGVPQAHEDDALRAARAAMEMLAEVESSEAEAIELRVGIESGEVLAGVDAVGHGFVSGAVVTLAKRLLEDAAPGEARVGPTTLGLLGDKVTSAVKGEGPDAAAAIVALVERSAPPADRIDVPPLVGRRDELQALHVAFAGVVEARAARLLLLVGEPGIGKTRLARELTAQVDGRATIASGRCLSYGQALTYWPLIEALRTLGEPAEGALELLVAGGATSEQQLAWNVQQALDQAAKKRPLLVVLEDLHWAEPALLDLLESVTESSVDAPILVFCLARPELLERRPAWAGTVTNVLLGPLAPADSASLLGHLDRPLEDDARERVLRLAAGNPLFLEELSAFVTEGGTAEMLPPRIQVLLQARLDLLPEPERLLLATAALEGMVFHRGALEALLPEEQRPDLAARLAALTGKLLLHPTVAQLDRESAFRFRHQLIRDAAYAALPKSDRGRLHEAFADWIEQRGAGRIELEDIDAYHLEQAALLKRELGAGEPALQRRAVTALAAAAERASRRTDPRAAASFGRRALGLVEEDDPRAPELELELGFTIATLGHFDEAQPLLAHAEQNTQDSAVKAAIQIARLHGALHFAPEGGVAAAIRRECAEAIPLFEQRGDHRWLGRAWHALGDAEWGQLRAQACADAYEKAAAEAEVAGDRSLRSRALMQRLGCLGQTRITFTSALEEAERLSEEFPGEPAIEASAGLIRVFAALNDGRRDEARALAPQSVEAFRSAGYRIWAAINTAMVGLQELFSGDVEEAERLVLDGIAELEELNERLFRGLAKTYLAQIRLAQGRDSEALQLADEAVHDSGPDDRRAAVAVNSVRARAYVHLGEIEGAKAAAATAVTIAAATDALHPQAVAQYALAETLAAAGDLAAAIEAAEEAVRLWTTLDRKPLRQFAAALAEQIERDREAVATPVSQTS